MKIHVIEDDSIYGEFIKRILEQESTYKVSVFPSGEDWLKASPGLPDAIISDYYLSGMTGLEFFEKIKEDMDQDNKFILISSVDDSNTLLEFIRKGVRNYVIKNDDMIDSIRSILAGNEDTAYHFG
jgi:DNA-binding NarL/FixJ family response regulator